MFFNETRLDIKLNGTNISNFGGNLTSDRVIKNTGTNFLGILLDSIIDSLVSFIDDLNVGLSQNVTDTRISIIENVTKVRLEIATNVTSLESSINLNTTFLQSEDIAIRSEIITNSSRKIQNFTDVSLIIVNATVVNTTTLNATGISGSLDWEWLYAVPLYIRDYTDPINNNITAVRSEIASNTTSIEASIALNFTELIGRDTEIINGINQNITDIRTSIDDNITKVRAEIATNVTSLEESINLNHTDLLINISAINTTLGKKLDRGEVTNFDDSDLIVGMLGNISNLEANDTAQFTNISNMNTSLGGKADRIELILQLSLDDIIAGINQNITDTRASNTDNTTKLRLEIGTNFTQSELNISVLSSNVSVMNTTQGKKADRSEVVSSSVIDEVIAGIIQNITDTRASNVDNTTSLESSINLNHTDLLVNISLINTSLGQKLDSATVGNKVENNSNVNFIFVNATVVNGSNVYVNTSIYMGIEDIGSNFIYFYDDGSPTGEFINWKTANNWFEFSNSVNVGNALTVSTGGITTSGDIRTTGAGDDLWLGISTQSAANFQAFADGRLKILDLNISNNKVNISSSGDINATKFYGAFDGVPKNATDARFVNLNVTYLNATNISLIAAPVASKQFVGWIWNNGSHIIMD